MESLLEHLLVILIRCVSFTDFAALLGLALPLIWDFDKSRR
jgi:hypothetical protein